MTADVRDSVLFGREQLASYGLLKGRPASIKRWEMSVVEEYTSRHLNLEPYKISHLDVGTCTGRYTSWALSRSFASVYGIDASHDAIEMCQRSVRDAVFLHRDIRALDLAHFSGLSTGKFHLTTMMMGTLNHIAESEHMMVFSKVHQVLHAGGILLFSNWERRTWLRCFSFYSKEEIQFIDENAGSVESHIEELGGAFEKLDTTERDGLRVYVLRAI
jgi:2-polyprenyl-3-methyl-5-hydroxy-6-metoxy-1,4-benzoquinol methylase